MPLPTILYNYFNQGREQLEMSSALMNPYAKWMQSPNIPRNTCLPIALGNVEVHGESEPNVDEWFKNFEMNSIKLQLPVPKFFPQEYQNSNHYSTIHKGDQRWIHAILCASDPHYMVYSDNSKNKAILDLVTKTTNFFPKIYDASVFRLYGLKKAEIYSSLFKNTNPAGLHIFSSVINKNIIIVREYGYELCSKLSMERETLCLWEHSGDVGSIVHVKNTFIDIQTILSNKMDLFEDRTKRILIAYNKDFLKKGRELGKMKLDDLRQNATDSGISFESDGKMLRKQELVDNILQSFMEHSS